jgi:hypothetical protein
VHSVFGTHQSVGARAAHDECHTLQPGFFAGRLIDDLDLESMALCPFQVHAHQHLDPVLRLHPTLADGDRHHGVVICIRVREQQVELTRTQLSGQRSLLLSDLLCQLWVA